MRKWTHGNQRKSRIVWKNTIGCGIKVRPCEFNAPWVRRKFFLCFFWLRCSNGLQEFMVYVQKVYVYPTKTWKSAKVIAGSDRRGCVFCATVLSKETDSAEACFFGTETSGGRGGDPTCGFLEYIAFFREINYHFGNSRVYIPFQYSHFCKISLWGPTSVHEMCIKFEKNFSFPTIFLSNPTFTRIK